MSNNECQAYEWLEQDRLNILNLEAVQFPYILDKETAYQILEKCVILRLIALQSPPSIRKHDLMCKWKQLTDACLKLNETVQQCQELWWGQLWHLRGHCGYIKGRSSD